MPSDAPLHAPEGPGGDVGVSGGGPGGVTVGQSAAGASPAAAPAGGGPGIGVGGGAGLGNVVVARADVVESALCELAGLIHAANAELLGLLAEFDRLGGWQGVGIRSLGHWAAIHLGIDARTAGAQARVGHRLGELPAIAAACAAGEIGWAKARVLADVAEPATDQRWLDLAREMSVTQLTRCASAYRRASDTDDPDRLEGARQRRGIWLFDEPDGLVRVTGLLEADDAAVLRAALAARAETLWRTNATGTEPATEPGDETTNGVPDPVRSDPAHDQPAGDGPGDGGGGGAAPFADPADRADAERMARAHEAARPSEVDPTLSTRDTAATRRADALVALARTALSTTDVPDDGDDLTQVVLHVDIALFDPANQIARSHLTHGPAIATPTAQRLACDPVIRPLLTNGGTPLATGRTQRLVNRAQRRALHIRDHGCAFPGCGATRHLHAHHIHHWTRGGPTDLDNLVLLCRHHHRLHHEGGYRITLTKGRPHFHRPDNTPIRPPDRPRHPTTPITALLHRRSRHHGHTITHHTPRARSGGAPHWSPQHAIDALTT
jgi:hypothetical protein